MSDEENLSETDCSSQDENDGISMENTSEHEEKDSTDNMRTEEKELTATECDKEFELASKLNTMTLQRLKLKSWINDIGPNRGMYF